jgi:hypothetical protein
MSSTVAMAFPANMGRWTRRLSPSFENPEMSLASGASSRPERRGKAGHEILPEGGCRGQDGPVPLFLDHLCHRRGIGNGKIPCKRLAFGQENGARAVRSHRVGHRLHPLPEDEGVHLAADHARKRLCRSQGGKRRLPERPFLVLDHYQYVRHLFPPKKGDVLKLFNHKKEKSANVSGGKCSGVYPPQH